MRQLRASKEAISVVTFIVLMSHGVTVRGQMRPKDHYKDGEKLLKQNQVYDAFQEFSQAAKLEPANKKYQTKLTEVGKVASVRAEAEARQEANVRPHMILLWLRRAVEYDPSNASAAEWLIRVRNDVDRASRKAAEAQDALNRGDLQVAEEIIKSNGVFVKRY
ncbi:MAG TPA: hypothetical protein VJH03_01510 [Blastocatellia bacterium]|nr:hypothetical protein [Blastocatellia bacterium]